MPHTAVSTTRRNNILNAIQEIGLNPGDFDWTQEPTVATQVGAGREPYTVDVLRYRPTDHTFMFDVKLPQGSWWPIYDPGPEGTPRREHAGSWENVWIACVGWLNRVKAEHDAPDLWAALREQAEVMTGDAVENTPFTPEEQLQIEATLTEAKEYARANLSLEPEQLERIESQLDYLIEAAQRPTVGRVDWRNLLIGSFLSLVLQSIVPVAPVQQLLFIVMHGLAAMFGGGGPMLPGGPTQIT